ncbi:MAG: GNAT family N-acetyltransferase [Blastocatellia bacterium]
MKSVLSTTHSETVTTTGQAAPAVQVRELDELDYRAVLTLLAASPQQGVHLESLIADYGLTSPALRGRFFGCFEAEQLTGVALIGHQIMFCATDAALAHFADAALTSGLHLQSCVIFGLRRQVDLFWQYLAACGREQRLARDFQWFVCAQPTQPVRQFRLVQAGPEHLEMVSEAHASMFIEATGADPRRKDPEGFRRRALERIERGRTWIVIEDGEVVFKAELQSVTPDAIYLEGIWTHPSHREHGLAKSSVVELTHRRLRRQQVICLVVEPEEKAAQYIYEHAGFHYEAEYRAVYLQPVNEA